MCGPAQEHQRLIIHRVFHMFPFYESFKVLSLNDRCIFFCCVFCGGVQHVAFYYRRASLQRVICSARPEAGDLNICTLASQCAVLRELSWPWTWCRQDKWRKRKSPKLKPSRGNESLSDELLWARRAPLDCNQYFEGQFAAFVVIFCSPV